MTDEYLIPAKHIDRDGKASRLMTFKDELSSNHFVSYFSSEEEFSTQLNNTFSNLQRKTK